MSDVMEFVRRRGGTVAAASAVVGFTIGAAGVYQLAHPQPAPRILLRQATEGDPMSTFDETPGSGGILILLRNDSTTPVEVTDAAFARTSAAPPLYIAPDTVPPGADVNVFVPVPGTCFASLTRDSSPTKAAPVQILVNASLPGHASENVPVEVVGQLAEVLDACHSHSSGH